MRRKSSSHGPKGVDPQEILRVYKQGGLSSRAMAEKLGITPQAFYASLKRQNVPTRRGSRPALPSVTLTYEQESNILKMFNSGRLCSFISSRLKIPKKQVNEVLVYHNAYAGSRFDEYLEEWKYFHSNGMTIQMISQFSGFPEEEVSNTLKCAGVNIKTGRRSTQA